MSDYPLQGRCFGFFEYSRAVQRTEAMPFASLTMRAVEFTFSHIDSDGNGVVSNQEIVQAIVKRDCLNGDLKPAYCNNPRTYEVRGYCSSS